VSSQRILIFIPTYNESGNVERMVRELTSLHLAADLLFLDDNSPDGTGALLEKLASETPRMSVIHRKGKEGIGSAHQEGIRWAYDGGYDVLVTLDCDFTHDPRDIPVMLKALKGHAVTVGSRYMERGSLPGWNFMRRCLTILGHFLTTVLLKLPQDASGAFRAYDLKAVRRELFSLVTSASYPFFFESLFVLVRNGMSINEIPIILPARTYGHSKLTPREALRGGMYLLRLWLESLAHPERFRIGRKIDAVLDNAQAMDWDAYWSKKHNAGALIYEIIAAIYRKVFIRPSLERALKENFSNGALILHAGCGSGQADVNLHAIYNITAIDISMAALELYSRNNPEANRVEQVDIFHLPYGAGTFDGVFNLGVMEHFNESQIKLLLSEFRRVLKPGGRLVLFWPHAKASSVLVLKFVHWFMRAVLRKETLLHPDEVTLMSGRKMAAVMCDSMNFKLLRYQFGLSDMYVQVVVVAEKL